MNCTLGRLIALSMRSHQAVTNTFNLRDPPGDQTAPRVLDLRVVGCRSGFPPCVTVATTVSWLRCGSVTGMAEVNTGAERLYSVGGLNAVLCVPRSRTASTGRNSMPACQVLWPPKS